MSRLLFLTERFPPDLGGVATSAGRITQTLCELGVEVDVVTWSRYLRPGEVSQSYPLHEKTRTYPRRDIDEQPRTTQSPNRQAPTLHRIGLYRHWDMTMPHTLNVLDGLHQTKSYTAVWGHYLFPAGFLAVWFAELYGLPSTVSARGNDLDRGMFPPGDFARLQWTLERASLLTTVSQDLAHKLACLSHRQAEVIGNAIDPQIFTPQDTIPSQDTVQSQELRASLGIADEEVVLGFSGELREKKGQMFLLNALTTVRQYRPACLLIIGEVRAAQEPVLSLYAAQHPDDAKRVLVTGHLSDPRAIAQHLRLCDLYLQPSLWEGLPNALLEAMACGLGCIGSDAGGIPDVIQSGVNGFLLPRSQLHQLGTAALEWFALEPAIQDQIKQRARDRILNHYSLNQEKISLQRVLQQLIPQCP